MAGDDTDNSALVAPPEDFPKYVINPLARQSSERLRVIADWIQELADAKEAAEPDTDDLSTDSEEIVEVENPESGPTVVIKKVPCGKSNCTNCPHGPYKYYVTRDGDSLSWDYRGTADESEV